MDLGSATLKRNGINILQNALSPRYGLVWTDGRTVYRTPISVHNHKLSTHPQTSLCSFEYVQSVHWSAPVSSSADGLLCIVHEKDVSIRMVDDNATPSTLRQSAKLKVLPLSQGVLWNPCSNVLCLLESDRVNIYTDSLRNLDSSIFGFTFSGKGRISCGCWSHDGRKLYVAVGYDLVVFECSDIQSGVKTARVDSHQTLYTFSSRLCSIERLSESVLVCSFELPMKRFLPLGDSDILNWQSDGLNERGDFNATASVLTDSLNSVNVQHKTQPETAHLILFDTAISAILDTMTIPVIITPNLMIVINTFIIIGSNASNTLIVFGADNNKLEMRRNINLPDAQRPKGLTSCGVDNLLVMTGEEKATTESILMPLTSSTAEYSLRLKLFSGFEKGCKELSKSQICDHMESGDHETAISLPWEDTGSQIELHLFNGQRNMRKLIDVQSDSNSNNQENDEQELETELCSFDSQSRKFSNSIDRLVNNFTSVPSVADNPVRLSCTVLNLPSKTQKHRTSPVLEKTRSIPFIEPSKKEPCVMNSREYKAFLNSPSVSGEELPFHTTDYSLETDTSLAADPCGHRGTCSQRMNVQPSHQVDLLQSQLDEQKVAMLQISQQLDELIRRKESNERLIQYKSAENPDTVELGLKGGASQTGTEGCRCLHFVLDNGRLSLDVVKEAFNLKTVHLFVGDVPCILSPDKDGYIPLVFTPRKTYYITGGLNVKVSELVKAIY